MSHDAASDAFVQGSRPEPWETPGWRALPRQERIAVMLAWLRREFGR